MTRLIDADAVEKVLEEKHFNRVLDSDRWIIADIKKSIMDLPTIDAIPIEWILNHERMPKEGKGHDAIMDMIKDWRREHDEIH